MHLGTKTDDDSCVSEQIDLFGVFLAGFTFAKPVGAIIGLGRNSHVFGVTVCIDLIIACLSARALGADR